MKIMNIKPVEFDGFKTALNIRTNPFDFNSIEFDGIKNCIPLQQMLILNQNMRNFNTEFSAHPKLQPLVAEISWTKNLLVMERPKAIAERLRLWASSAGTAADADQPEVKV